MKTLREVPNYRMIKVSFIAPTNHRGMRIKIYETNRYNDQKTESKVFGFNYEYNDVQEQAFEILTRNGFNVVCKGSEYGCFVFMCDCWGEGFKSVKDLK